MAAIFLSYRRTDGPQACRIHDWLSQRFGGDAVFMDVAAIPFAVSFSDFIREAIEESKVMIALIGSGWQDRINEPDDPVRMEIEVAISNRMCRYCRYSSAIQPCPTGTSCRSRSRKLRRRTP